MRPRLGIRAPLGPLCVAAAFAALTAAGAGAQPGSAAPLLRAFFEALNSDRPEAMTEFAERGMTEGFRARRSAEEDRAFYQRLRSDLGRLELRQRLGPSRARALLRAEKVPMPAAAPTRPAICWHSTERYVLAGCSTRSARRGCWV